MTSARAAPVSILILALLTAWLAAQAQPVPVYRVGVVFLGGPYSAAVDGLRDGLKKLGLEEGKQFILHVRDLKGDARSVPTAARSLEREKVDLIYSVGSAVTAEVKRATQSVPIVFYAGSDPVAVGLVDSFRRPGGRLTGIHILRAPLMAKRLELLKEMIPTIRRGVHLYDSGSPIAQKSADSARDAARQAKVQLLELPVHSVNELRTSLDALGPGDAVFYVDAMIMSHIEMILDASRRKKIPIILGERERVVEGALASYGASYYSAGQLAAKQVQRVLLGASPADMPVEQVEKLHFAINLKTAKALGLTIPRSVLIRADEVIE